MPPKNSVDFNDAWFEELAKSPEVDAVVEEAADGIAAKARSTAPVESGDYRSRIVVEKVIGQRRNIFRVVGRDWKTMIIESKTGNLARSLQKSKRRG